MFKKVLNLVGIGVAVYEAMKWGCDYGSRQFYQKLVEKAEKHPEMTLAQLVFEKEEV